jgi:DNA modification methylase
MKIQTLQIKDLTPDPNNARQHDDKNLKAIQGSLKEFGQRKPIVITEAGVIVAGNGTVEAAKRLGWLEIQAVTVPGDWTPEQTKAFALADNRTAELASWSPEVLAAQLLELEEAGFEIEEFGFEKIEVAEEPREIVEDEIPQLAPKRVALGDVWQLGEHRVMCGDSTKEQDVKKLMNGKTAALLHADPPYGMGKEKDGVENDNLYKEKLDKFQIDWFKASRKSLTDNASIYIWGNPEDLWRLWYSGGLKDVEPLTLRNEIVWSKASGIGQRSELMRCYPINTERCLFFMLGQQGFNTNSDNYWQGWEPLRSYLDSETQKMGWAKKDLNKITNSQMGQHYITTSQWAFPTQQKYELIQEAAAGKGFLKSYKELRAQYEALKSGSDEVKESFYSTRSYFDNVHDNMNEVWQANRVQGEERHGHATPKPIELMARVMKSSLPKGGLCYEPFAGSGSTLIAAEQTNRVCYTMELTPEYCDVILQRWETLTGQTAKLVSKTL